MKIFDNVQAGIFQIRQLIWASDDLKKLVYYDDANALSSTTVPTIAEVTPHIVVAAIFDVTEPPFDKNTIISIVLNRGNYDEEKVLLRGIVKITVLTRSEIWELSGNKIRPLEISNIIIDKLNNQKISPSHKMSFSNIELAILNENVNGYTISFFLEEGSGLDEQF
jgi:hypothetical protein